jgi:hypothetical protein
MLEKFGYNTDDVYERIRQEIKKCNLFRFDWFFKSRTSAEISKRCQTLVSLVQREAGITFTGALDDDSKTENTKAKPKAKGKPKAKAATPSATKA